MPLLLTTSDFYLNATKLRPHFFSTCSATAALSPLPRGLEACSDFESCARNGRTSNSTTLKPGKSWRMAKKKSVCKKGLYVWWRCGQAGFKNQVKHVLSHLLWFVSDEEILKVPFQNLLPVTRARPVVPGNTQRHDDSASCRLHSCATSGLAGCVIIECVDRHGTLVIVLMASPIKTYFLPKQISHWHHSIVALGEKHIRLQKEKTKQMAL